MVTDLSTNGTYLNSVLLGKGVMKLLSNLDELSLLMPNNKNVPSIRYVYKEPEAAPGPLEEYQIRQMLGAGSYAKVHLGVHKTTGQQVAVKIIDKKKMVGGSSRADAVHDEVSTLQRVSHPNIIRIFNHFEDETSVYLVLELVVGGELFDFVVKYADGKMGMLGGSAEGVRASDSLCLVCFFFFKDFPRSQRWPFFVRLQRPSRISILMGYRIAT